MDAVHFMSENPAWQTPPEIFEPLHRIFRFTIDVAATPENALLPRFYTPEQDGLRQDWSGERVWCNPPYGRGMERWVEKLASGEAEFACGFIPARTDTKWFHRYVIGRAEVHLVKGRVKFVGAKSCAPFPSMLCLWGAEAVPGFHGAEQ